MVKMCLDIKTKNIKTNDIIWGVLENGHECDQMFIESGTNDFCDRDVVLIKDYIEKIKADIVITMDFCPTISQACHEKDIPYASWIYDSPVQAIYHEQAHMDTNFFFVFDKYLLNTIKKEGIKNAYYLPMAANVTRMGMLEIDKEDERRFSCDVSFVGSAYRDRRFEYFRNGLNEEQGRELDRIFNDMLGRWDGTDRVHDVMSTRLLEALHQLIADKEDFAKRGIPYRTYFEEEVLPKAAAYQERNAMMSQVADYNPRWYGENPDDDSRIPGVSYLPRLKYEEELPKAYFLSKVNLSTSLHSISSGLPMRVFDIIGAGGFVLSNYQSEAEELFDVGKEIILYHDFSEMEELLAYYLSHDKERIDVLKAGYNKVCAEYTYPKAIRTIFSKVF